ncbi:MAG TPA: UDP-N-acetylmuramoyl-L-alanine--D-glutamate ligase [Candidatus Saccharimonadales bacterium]|nr:UDP-N-acetylmuramoyl-L-alanine--D-glutamate ligase [Candidatus Saccharimonadales bacterium]
MKVAIAGYGAEGESNYRYWNTPSNQVVIIDEREPAQPVPVDASIIVGDDAFMKLEGYDLVIRTAGLAPRKIKTDGKIWSATNEFFAKCPAPIIGVTGTKGKGTTCSLIASILRAAGKNVHLVGNIGVPALDVLSEITADDVVVYELSSFQLWDIEKSPQTAVILPIEPDHLDVHADFEDYVAAKANITEFQKAPNVVIWNTNDELTSKIAENSTAIWTPYLSELGAYVKDDWFWFRRKKVCSTNEMRIPGRHNVENACAAITAAWYYVPGNFEERNVTDDFASAVVSGLNNFSGLPHRLKFVRTVNSVDYYDDSISTTPGSAIAGMYAFKQPKVLILGGSSKGANFDELAAIANETNVKSVLLIGDEADNIEAAFRSTQVKVINLGKEVAMPEIVASARQQATAGDVVILSPSCASFGMFKNYSDRGDQFIAAVNALEES